jgi:hypothetical protein
MSRNSYRAATLLALAAVGASIAVLVRSGARRDRRPETALRGALAPPSAHRSREDWAAVRPAGRDAMRDPPRDWDALDEALDESFPASDPPATY